ncbi:MAG: metallophosphoesterase [Syntrophobacteraceae bacterium]
MRKIVHISDLHFGAVQLEAAAALVPAIVKIAPDLVVVSGDLTQRARSEQFIEARKYLDTIPFTKLIVPGNHDVPLFNPIRRFLSPLEGYLSYICRELAPHYRDSEMSVLGVNTARSLTWKNGRISREQMRLIRDRFCSEPRSVWKVLVTHHPFLAPPGMDRMGVVGRAEEMFLEIEGCLADLFLAGHFHMSYAGQTHAVYTGAAGSALVIQAGTAVSTRTRREKNAFNLIELEDDRICLTVHMWDGIYFVKEKTSFFVKKNGGWVED